ncbi:aspartyl-phosphate phosphatase Spo0E family protein [Paenibacillus sp. IB182496]|uniref:Aspartyl-phosphate phosphatase Spo0E family protein n=1 Tax=Paenibacillus sabuli TaxID=2772509 RepID=A0A927BW92_9BACL|nr:aspartyl-phosphate phosphatase Spo0E family protein [Paenibacillus sabuli]MBD2846624.1 aspartyl-phosphate phosphatase Spo0E family protein [Paenibacillus sabuli]
MKELLHRFEEEKRRLHELARQSLEQGIPLGRNEAVQAQSRKVDEWILRLYEIKGRRGHKSR